MLKNSKIFVAGHRGLVGSAVVRRLEAAGYHNLLLRTHDELDLTDQAKVRELMNTEKPEYIILAAARVGGIVANSDYAAEFIHDNIVIEANVIDAAYRSGAKRLMFLGSSCIYPKFAAQPLKERYLLASQLETTNEWYAVAKIAGIKMCQAYRKQYGFESISLMPTNLYGPNDNFDLNSSHVLPAMIRKFHEAKLAGSETVEIWGTGNPMREFLYVDDLAEACIYVLEQSSATLGRIAPDGIINVGTGIDVTILELAELIAEKLNFRGSLEFDTTKPDGTPRKVLDVSRMRDLGWRASTDLAAGIVKTYDWFTSTQGNWKGNENYNLPPAQGVGSVSQRNI